MGYPAGAGPEGGYFGAAPMAAVSPVSPAARARPSSQPVTAVSGLGGTVKVATLGPSSANGWLVRRIALRASEWSMCRIYIGGDLTGALAAPEEAATWSGDSDVYDAAQPIYVPPGESLFIVWASGAGTASARVTYEEVL